MPTGKGIHASSPHAQILRYLATAENVTDGQLRWGILTNGLRLAPLRPERPAPAPPPTTKPTCQALLNRRRRRHTADVPPDRFGAQPSCIEPDRSWVLRLICAFVEVESLYSDFRCRREPIHSRRKLKIASYAYARPSLTSNSRTSPPSRTVNPHRLSLHLPSEPSTDQPTPPPWRRYSSISC